MFLWGIYRVCGLNLGDASCHRNEAYTSLKHREWQKQSYNLHDYSSNCHAVIVILSMTKDQNSLFRELFLWGIDRVCSLNLGDASCHRNETYTSRKHCERQKQSYNLHGFSCNNHAVIVICSITYEQISLFRDRFWVVGCWSCCQPYSRRRFVTQKSNLYQSKARWMAKTAIEFAWF